jgi:rRNA maturation RNase YbeY
VSLDLDDVPAEYRPAVRAALAAAGVGDGHLALELVEPARIRELNRAHRGLDQPTDVLSFPIDGAEAPTAGPRELGDIVICPEHTDDLTTAAIHGALHLCGYDHERDRGEMLELQARALADLPGQKAVAEGPEIREARPEEARRMIEMYDWLFSPPGAEPAGWDPAAAERRLLAAIASLEALVLVAAGTEREQGQLVGLCTAYIDIDSVRYGTRCWVEDLAVDPARRSAGIGAALLARARQWARASGATHLELDSAEVRREAHRFYEGQGGEGPSYLYGWWLT